MFHGSQIVGHVGSFRTSLRPNWKFEEKKKENIVGQNSNHQNITAFGHLLRALRVFCCKMRGETKNKSEKKETNKPKKNLR